MEKGLLHGLKRGKVILTARVEGTNYETSCELEVIPATITFYTDNGKEKISSSYKCEKGQSFSVSINDRFNSINTNEVVYSSSDDEVAIIDQNGTVTTKEAGKVTITATLKGLENVKKTFRLEVTTAVNDLKIYEDQYNIYSGDKSQLDFEVLPSNATNKNLKYNVSNKQVASVSSNGKIIGKKGGTTTITISSKSNPDIQKQVTVNVTEQRDYRLVDSSQIVQNQEYIVKYVKTGETINIKNNYSENAVIKCNNDALIKYEVTNSYIKVTGLKRGIATISITDGGLEDKIKVLVNKYIDDETDANIKPVEKIVISVKESDLLEGTNYINDTTIEVGQTWSFKYYVAPKDASLEDLQYSISNEKDFSLSSNGKVTAINPDKTTKLTVSSKSNPNVTKTITLTSEIGGVEKVEFARAYVGDSSLDINKSKSFPFNPIFYMKNGKVFDPRAEDLSNDATYKKLLKRIKIKTNDTDIIKISNNNAIPIEGVNGSGVLELVFDEGKGTEKRATTNFYANGVVVESIKSIRFAKSKYEINEGGDFNFNPIITTNTNKTYNPEKEGVRESQEYQNLLSNVQLEKIAASGEYVGTGNLVSFITNNAVRVVYEGKCKLKMVVPGTNISAETILDVNFNRDVEKQIDFTRYVGAKSVMLVSDKDNSSTTGVVEVTKGTELFAHEKYKNGWVRVSYNGNDNLYIKASNLTQDPPQSATSSDDVAKVINDYRYIGKSGVKLSPPAGGGSDISVEKGTKIYVFEKYKNGWVRVSYNGNDNLYIKASNLTQDPPQSVTSSDDVAKVINDYRYIGRSGVKLSPPAGGGSDISVEKGTKIYVFEKYKNGWVRVNYNGNDNLYIESSKLTQDPPASNADSYITGKVTASCLNVRNSPSQSSDVLGVLYNQSTVKILEITNGWCTILYNNEEAYVSAEFVREDKVSNTVSTPAPAVDNKRAQNILNTANEYLGVPYLWGGSTPSGFDCSGFVQYVMRENGISITRTTYTQWDNDGYFVSVDQLQPGDLVYFGDSKSPTHVGIYVGNGTYIHSPRTGDVVKYSSISNRNDCVGGKRVIY